MPLNKTNISSIRTHVLSAPLSKPFHWSFNRADKREGCIVEITDESGETGWGECFGPARLNAAVIEAFKPHLIGKDAFAIDAIWQQLHNLFLDQGQKGLAITALSGIDIALWDLKGKRLDEPVHRLLGGPIRTEVKAYATGTYRLDEGNPLDYVVREVEGYAAEGFHAVKIKIGFDVSSDAKLIKACRAAVGPDINLMIDANHGFDSIEAIRLGNAVAEDDIRWFEEPVTPDDLGSYEEVRRGQPIPVAGGECDFTRWGLSEILQRRAIDIIQPDTAAAGGLSECKKIADMAASFGIRYLPHVWGTGIGLAAALQLLAVLPDTPPSYTPKAPILEFDRSEHPFRQAILQSPIEHESGVVQIPQGSGLGIEIDRAALEQFRID
ncbi:MAG: mandelate racemase/muconate lactonizing enzyme family protein [Rhodospirillales bacterium]